MKHTDTITCESCNSHSAVLHWEPRYDGHRGTCMVCGGDWPES